MTITHDQPAPSFISNVWQGKYSIAQHYWLFLVVPSAVIKLFIMLLDVVPLETEEQVRNAGFVELALAYPVWGAVAIVGGVGLWRASARRGWPFWGIIACILWVLGMLAGVINGLGFIFIGPVPH